MESLTIINAILIFILAFAVSSICIPLVIKLAKKRNLYDENGGRHIHKGRIPRLGGIAIFFGLLFSQLYFVLNVQFTGNQLESYLLLLFVLCLLFLLGLLDDLVNVRANFKFLIQLVVGFVIVVQADVRIASLEGLFGVYELPEIYSYTYSIILLVFLINAFNLIDGLDSLSSSLGIVVFSCFLYIFVFNNMYIESFLCISVLGSLLGFWFYNKPPAKIFMGDSGTLGIGLLLAYCSLRLSSASLDLSGAVNPVIPMVILAYPAIDTLRVFTNRIVKGRSPFSPDRNHIHHILYDLGLGHGIATLVIISTNTLIVAIVYCFRSNVNLSFWIALVLTVVLSQVPGYLLQKRKRLLN
jgi:UDP-GlcNAc:undecaprenyl-phosphate GlcNAc-1-phosphate transferase